MRIVMVMMITIMMMTVITMMMIHREIKMMMYVVHV